LLQQQGLTLLSATISYLSVPDDPTDELLILTTFCELVSVESIETLFSGKSNFDERFCCKKNNSLFAFTGLSTALCILEKRDSTEQLLFCCTSDERIVGISLRTHEIVDMWRVS
jgi:hypothetical protein